MSQFWVSIKVFGHLIATHAHGGSTVNTWVRGSQFCTFFFNHNSVSMSSAWPKRLDKIRVVNVLDFEQAFGSIRTVLDPICILGKM